MSVTISERGLSDLRSAAQSADAAQKKFSEEVGRADLSPWSERMENDSRWGASSASVTSPATLVTRYLF